MNPKTGSHPDVSIVMPCLNEAESLATCIQMAQEALSGYQDKLGLSGEIVIADNGSTDGSQLIAEQLGARVVDVAERGYGAALIGGLNGARGRYLVMGDADGSYDFRQSVAMIEKLQQGADICMGSRFKGQIEPGAMPWKNRYLGNPVLTGILNLFYRSGISDAHCGLRALTKDALERLSLSSQGMEFASEMVVKAAIRGLKMQEVPVKLSRDLRERPPHLRPWRDGWRHLRFLLMLSPFYLFGAPALLGMMMVAVILVGALIQETSPNLQVYFGNYWVVLAVALANISLSAAFFSAGAYLVSVREGIREPSAMALKTARVFRLEVLLLIGGGLATIGMAALIGVTLVWTFRDFVSPHSILPAAIGTLLTTLGVQCVFGAFMLSIIAGFDSAFLTATSSASRAGKDV